MNTPVYCANCGCFSTEGNVWPLKEGVVCVHCFVCLTGETPYQCYSVFDCERLEEDIEFSQILREIDLVRQCDYVE